MTDINDDLDSNRAIKKEASIEKNFVSYVRCFLSPVRIVVACIYLYWWVMGIQKAVLINKYFLIKCGIRNIFFLEGDLEQILLVEQPIIKHCCMLTQKYFSVYLLSDCWRDLEYFRFQFLCTRRVIWLLLNKGIDFNQNNFLKSCRSVIFVFDVIVLDYVVSEKRRPTLK